MAEPHKIEAFTWFLYKHAPPQPSQRSKMLTYEPVLHWLDIDDLLKIRQLDKTSRDLVDGHLKTKKKFTTSMYYTSDDRKTIRALSSLSHLTLQLPSVYNKAKLEDYFTPSLESLTIVLHGQFDFEDNLFAPRKYVLDNYHDTLEILHEKLTTNELPLLHEIHVQLAPLTELGEAVTLKSVEDYDYAGPIYEIEFITNVTSLYDPIHYWILACKYSEYAEGLSEKIIAMLSANPNKWTKISYPYDFFGAALIEEMYPQARWTNWLTEKPETIQGHIDAVLAAEAVKANICSLNGYYKCSICRTTAAAAAPPTAAASEAQSSSEHA